MSRTLLQMALDALTSHQDLLGTMHLRLDAIAALREALADPELEPVGHLHSNGEFCQVRTPKAPAHWPIDLYAAPPAAPAPAAPVPDGMETNADEVICPNCAHQFRAIPENVQSLLLASGHEPPFTASPAAPAAPAAPVVPLTDEQIRSMWKSSEFRGNGGQVDWFCEGIRAAEAHHGITGASK